APSQPLIHERVHIVPQPLWFERREASEPLNEHSRAQSWPCQRLELGHGLAVSCDRDGLAGLDPIEDLAPVVPQVTHRRFTHEAERITRETGGLPPSVTDCDDGTTWLGDVLRLRRQTNTL